MKRTKLSRILSIALAGTMVVGCISFNTFAEEIIGEEVVMEEAAAFTLEEELSVGVEEVVAEEEMFSEDAFVEEEEIIIAEEDEVVMDFSSEEETWETESEYVEEEFTTEGMEMEEEEFMLDMSGEMDAVDSDVLLGDAEVQQEVAPTTIALNYDEYTLNSVGETMLLVATVSGTQTEAAVETVAEDSLVEETELMTEAAEEEVVEETAAEENVADEVVLVNEVTEIVAMDATVSWSSSDESVATVDGIGMVAAVATGEAIITCTLDSDPTIVATCKITVNADCILVEHVHSREECFVRELICSHTSDDEHTADCFSNMFICGLEEHVHDENCFENTMISDDMEDVPEAEEFVYED